LFVDFVELVRVVKQVMNNFGEEGQGLIISYEKRDKDSNLRWLPTVLPLMKSILYIFQIN
jgi:hypothetical protein